MSDVRALMALWPELAGFCFGLENLRWDSDILDLGSSFSRSCFLSALSIFMWFLTRRLTLIFLIPFLTLEHIAVAPPSLSCPAQSSVSSDIYKRGRVRLISSSILFPLLNFLRKKSEKCLLICLSLFSQQVFDYKNNNNQNNNTASTVFESQSSR